MSEKTLERLIATLKSEAIEVADKEAKAIVDKAHAQAQKIIVEAEAKSEQLLHDAQKKAQVTRNKGESELQQVARDLTLTVRNDLLKLLRLVLEKDVQTAFNPQLMENVILKVTENVGSGASLKLPGNLETKLANQIQKRLQEFDNLISITKDHKLLNGFSITKTDQGWSYHISSEEVAELLYVHLNQKWAHILQNK